MRRDRKSGFVKWVQVFAEAILLSLEILGGSEVSHVKEVAYNKKV